MQYFEYNYLSSNHGSVIGRHWSHGPLPYIWTHTYRRSLHIAQYKLVECMPLIT